MPLFQIHKDDKMNQGLSGEVVGLLCTRMSVSNIGLKFFPFISKRI